VRGFLLLKDGTAYPGYFVIPPKDGVPVAGEAVFNTGMTGYQEMITDPSYRGQILTLTYPLIGNYGTSDFYEEDDGPNIEGLIVSEVSELGSNYVSEGTLTEYLSEREVPLLAGVDTRSLVRHIRETGAVDGMLLTESRYAELRAERGERAGEAVPPTRRELVQEVSTKDIRRAGRGPRKIALIDYGAKNNIVRSLVERDCSVVIFPYDAKPAEILAHMPDGILLSNGPGDPKDVPGASETIRGLMESGTPVFGICLGHQLLALALGCDTYKLKYGHRGANHPVWDKVRRKAVITSQNHGYAVRADELPAEVELTHTNLNDGTVEGIRCRTAKAFSVQYHPEACPGPQDSAYLFDDFLEMIGAPHAE
jgi:carbamoyl-phosphate synthase small subunit